jgi:hypothetical protein
MNFPVTGSVRWTKKASKTETQIFSTFSLNLFIYRAELNYRQTKAQQTNFIHIISFHNVAILLMLEGTGDQSVLTAVRPPGAGSVE